MLPYSCIQCIAHKPAKCLLMHDPFQTIYRFKIGLFRFRTVFEIADIDHLPAAVPFPGNRDNRSQAQVDLLNNVD